MVIWTDGGSREGYREAGAGEEECGLGFFGGVDVHGVGGNGGTEDWIDPLREASTGVDGGNGCLASLSVSLEAQRPCVYLSV